MLSLIVGKADCAVNLYHTSAEVFGFALHAAANVVALAPSNVPVVVVQADPEIKVAAVAQVACDIIGSLKNKMEITRTVKALAVAFIKKLNFSKSIHTTVLI